MDETRKLLDSLMGQTRNASMEEAKKTKGKNFMKDSVCKGYLLGFCPLSELSESKMAGKRKIKPCDKTHSDALVDEFHAHADRAKLQAEYEKQLLPVLEGLAREADSWVSREKANVKAVTGAPPEKVTSNTMTEEQKESYDAMKADLNRMLAAAEEEAEKGNVDASKFKVMLADEVKEKVQELEEKHLVTYEVTHRGEDVCEICGTRFESQTVQNHARHMAHFRGKVHLAYVKIREWIADLKKKRGIEESNITTTDRRDGDRGGSPRRERRKSRSRREKERPRAGSREREQGRERERRRSRSRRDRDGDRERYRQRSRSRGDRRGRGRD